jgi:hypothetical protein
MPGWAQTWRRRSPRSARRGRSCARVIPASLYAGDGIHPSAAGSFLTACVFYVMLSGRDPEGDSFTAGLDRSQADALQTAAWIAAGPVTPAR